MSEELEGYTAIEEQNTETVISEPPAGEPESGAYAPEEPLYRESPEEPADRDASEKKPKRKKKRGALRVLALILVCALVGTAAGYGGSALHALLHPAPEPVLKQSSTLEGAREQAELVHTSVKTGTLMTPAEVYAANVGSTVGIRTEITTNFWGYQTTSAAAGSGFVLTADGYVLTNCHVIESADSITVSTYDGSEYPAELIGFDEAADIAVLKIEAEGLTPVVLGDSSLMRIGDPVVAIGNPLGELTFSLTQGAISALDRRVTFSDNNTMTLMQTDCAINSGNSGGALFNLYGEVIGITNGKYSGSTSSGASIDNIGFAIPYNSVRGLIGSIIETGCVVKPYIGVTVSTVSAEAQQYGLPQGASVRSTVEDSPAAKAGLQENDIITAVNGEPIATSQALVDIITASKPGDELELTVMRQQEELRLTVTVGEQVRSALESTKQDSQEPQDSQGFGFSFPFGFPGFGF